MIADDSQTLQKISTEAPGSIVSEGGLAALLNYLPFFPTAVQRAAVQAAANCCKNVSPENAEKIKECWSVLRDVLSQSDQKLVETATLAIVRTLESYRHRAELLEALLDSPTITAISAVLSQDSGPSLPAAIYTQLIKALASAAKASAKTTIALLEAGMTTTVYQILTGVLPSANDGSEQGESADGQGLAGGIADMAIQQNLARRPKEQIEEALVFINELLPPLQKSGVFDSHQYSERAYKRLKRAARHSNTVEPSDRITRQSSRAELSASAATSAPSTETNTPTIATIPLDPSADTSVLTSTAPASAADQDALKAKKEQKLQAEERIRMLQARPELMSNFVRAITPVLVDVCAASIATRVRHKVLSALARVVASAEPELLRETLRASSDRFGTQGS